MNASAADLTNLFGPVIFRFGNWWVEARTEDNGRRFLLLHQGDRASTDAEFVWSRTLGAPMDGAFLCRRTTTTDGVSFLVSGINPVYGFRFGFEDRSPDAGAHAHSVAMLGVPVLTLDEAQGRLRADGARLDWVR